MSAAEVDISSLLVPTMDQAVKTQHTLFLVMQQNVSFYSIFPGLFFTIKSKVSVKMCTVDLQRNSSTALTS